MAKPPAHQTAKHPPVALEQPRHGGSWLRQADGSLTLIDGPTKQPDPAAAPATTEPQEG